MEKLVESGRVRSIGISNFNSQQVDRIYKNSKIKPVINQVECHPNLNQLKLIEFCAARNISITAYSPLGRGRTILAEPKILELARKYQKSPAQIVLRYTVCFDLYIPINKAFRLIDRCSFSNSRLKMGPL